MHMNCECKNIKQLYKKLSLREEDLTTANVITKLNNDKLQFNQLTPSPLKFLP